MSPRKSRYGWYDVVKFLLTVFPLACFQVQICRFLSGVLEASRADAFWKFTIATANCVTCGTLEYFRAKPRSDWSRIYFEQVESE